VVTKRRGLLSADQVRNIRSEARHKMKPTQIARRYGVSESTVRRIIRYQTYRGDG
jgi:DNA invertase Pin-like site-specific DNA recombinase